jgi:hypothetical protein
VLFESARPDVTPDDKAIRYLSAYSLGGTTPPGWSHTRARRGLIRLNGETTLPHVQ